MKVTIQFDLTNNEAIEQMLELLRNAEFPGGTAAINPVEPLPVPKQEAAPQKKKRGRPRKQEVSTVPETPEEVEFVREEAAHKRDFDLDKIKEDFIRFATADWEKAVKLLEKYGATRFTEIEKSRLADFHKEVLSHE